MNEEFLLLGSGWGHTAALADLPALRAGTADQLQKWGGSSSAGLLCIAHTPADLGQFVAAALEYRTRKPRSRLHKVLVLHPLTAGQRTIYQDLFARVLAPGDGIQMLATNELLEALASDDRADRVIGVAVDGASQLVMLYRGNLDTVIVPFAWFGSPHASTRPDFSDFEPVDHGIGVRFGQYEAAVDAILYEFDPAYRRRVKRAEIGRDDDVGGSVRRLRNLRGLKQSDFPGISVKEIGRIERGEVKTPQRATLDRIASIFGVSVEDLRTY
ncbi:MAG TPA: helix-turn-helix transcriptional regulator [Longimicrobium sp.]|nr:helix-turn-helix transcriptional regulator [Longimicrobium sp.]